jgi:hypothetical protein
MMHGHTYTLEEIDKGGVLVNGLGKAQKDHQTSDYKRGSRLEVSYDVSQYIHVYTQVCIRTYVCIHVHIHILT